MKGLQLWLEVPAPEEAAGWRRVLCLEEYDSADQLPEEGAFEAMADAAAARQGLTGEYRWSLDFGGGARHRD